MGCSPSVIVIRNAMPLRHGAMLILKALAFCLISMGVTVPPAEASQTTIHEEAHKIFFDTSWSPWVEVANQPSDPYHLGGIGYQPWILPERCTVNKNVQITVQRRAKGKESTVGTRTGPFVDSRKLILFEDMPHTGDEVSFEVRYKFESDGEIICPVDFSPPDHFTVAVQMQTGEGSWDMRYTRLPLSMRKTPYGSRTVVVENDIVLDPSSHSAPLIVAGRGTNMVKVCNGAATLSSCNDKLTLQGPKEVPLTYDALTGALQYNMEGYPVGQYKGEATVIMTPP